MMVINQNELYHYGVKGMRWGVRKYQYADGTLTPEGIKRYRTSDNSRIDKYSYMMSPNVRHVINGTKYKLTGKQYIDNYLDKGLTLSRIQVSKDVGEYAFYATYKKDDQNKYLGLFGNNLMTRAARDVKALEKTANKTKNESDIIAAKDARSKLDNMKVYQLKFETVKKLKIPSDENASDITTKLLKDSEFKKNAIESIIDSKEKMRRPQQQLLFNQARNALNKDVNRLTKSEKISIYKALNLSLTNHNSAEVAVQTKLYDEMKKKGYNALLDYNDKSYSSYHAKRPVIIFDTDSVKLASVSEANQKVIDKMYAKYNKERLRKETISNTLGLISQFGNKTVSECYAYTDRKLNDYLYGKTNSYVDTYRKKHPNSKLTDYEIEKMYL